MKAPLYYFLKFLIALALKVYYRKVEVSGVEHVPTSGAVILAPNHQNAFMDALCTARYVSRRSIFLVQAGVFKLRIVAALFDLLGMMPVYRIRDGFRTVPQNEKIFQRSSRHLLKGGLLTMFPEGDHGRERRLRNYKKGMVRIAMRAVAGMGPGEDVTIVPIGMNYGIYNGFREDLHIRFGKPVSARKYLEQYLTSPQEAYRDLNKEIYQNHTQELIHISDAENYTRFNFLRLMFGEEASWNKPGSPFQRYTQEQALLKSLEKLKTEAPASFQSVCEDTDALKKLTDELGFSPTVSLASPPMASILLRLLSIFALFPLWVYGILNHFLGLVLPINGHKIVKPEQFFASVRMGAGLILVPAAWGLQTYFAWSLTHNSLFCGLYLLSLLLSGLVLLYVFTQEHWLRQALKVRSRAKSQPSQLEEAKRLKKKIAEMLFNSPAIPSVEQ